MNILEAEGLAPALNSIGRVLAGDGLDKHGACKWRTKGLEHHLKKALGHIESEGVDEGGSEELHTANAAARIIMALAKELEG